MRSREDLERLEDETLAPYALRSATSRGRRHDEPEDPFRPAYQRDRDRVVHSTAFRRLEYKTQVFVHHEGDHYRTRLTHSLEVAQLARSAAQVLRLNETFVEALSLAHDLGHPPFGHAGGEVLTERMRDHGGFEHNVQGLRIVDHLEKRYPDFDGLNLTFELREAILKHGPTGQEADLDEFRPPRPPALETRLVDLVDQVAYQHHDVDDGLRAGLLDLGRMAREVAIVERCRREVVERHGRLPERMEQMRVVDALVKRLLRDLLATSAARLAEAAPRSPDEARSLPGLVGFSEEVAAERSELQAYLFRNLYRHHRVVRTMDKAKRLLGQLFDTYLERPHLLPPSYQRRAERDGLERTVCDYLAGMTDRYAQEDWRRLFDPAVGG